MMRYKTDCLLGIDLGSEYLKAVIFDLQGKIVGQGRARTMRCHPDPAHPDWVVWDPEQIWAGAAAAASEAVAMVGDASRIRAVAVTGMGMDGVPVDQDGRWLYPFISWLDPRTAKQFEWWKRNIGAERSFAIGGNRLWPYNTAMRLLWMAEHQPEILARTHKWLLIEDFLNFMLSGIQATDYSMASSTLLFDLHEMGWSEELLAASGIRAGLLCDPTASGTLLGEVTDNAASLTGLLPGTPVVLGGHDYLCGVLPAGGFQPGNLVSVTGNWEIAMTSLPEPNLSTKAYRAGISIEAHAAHHTYAAYRHWRSLFGEPQFARLLQRATGDDIQFAPDWVTLDAAAAKALPGRDGLVFHPHLPEAGDALDDPHSPGTFTGLDHWAGLPAIMHAVIQSLNDRLTQEIRIIENSLEVGIEKITVIGEMAGLPYCMQNRADTTQLPVEALVISEPVCRGAAMLAGMGAGLFENETEAFAQLSKTGREYQPDPT